VELLIAVALVIILSAVSVIGYQAVMSGVREKQVKAKMSAIGAAANTFRTAMGQGRYPTLQELTTRQAGQTAALIPDLTLDASGCSTYAGYTICQALTPADRAFGAYAYPVGNPPGLSNTNKYFVVYEDGVLRRGTSGSVVERTAPIVQQ
jgi:type II secretory pathway pseudopilin PulG